MEGWRRRGKHPIVEADSELDRTGLFKYLRLWNSTLLTAGCVLWHNTDPDTHTHTWRAQQFLSKGNVRGGEVK